MTMRIEEVRARLVKHNRLKVDCEKSMFRLKDRLSKLEHLLDIYEGWIRGDLRWLKGKGNGND